MPGSLLLTLDTTAPVVTWGPVDGADASLDLTVLYTVDEPGIDHAEIELLDDRVLPMVVAADRLTVTLPDDAPQGAATIRAYVIDAVDNAAVRTLVIGVGGVLPPPPPTEVTPTGGMPQPPISRVDFGRSGARARSVYTVRCTTSYVCGGEGGSLYTTPSHDVGWNIVLALPDGFEYTVRRGQVAFTDSATSGERTFVRRLPEGGGGDEELLLLDLL